MLEVSADAAKPTEQTSSESPTINVPAGSRRARPGPGDDRIPPYAGGGDRPARADRRCGAAVHEPDHRSRGARRVGAAGRRRCRLVVDHHQRPRLPRGRRHGSGQGLSGVGARRAGGRTGEGRRRAGLDDRMRADEGHRHLPRARDRPPWGTASACSGSAAAGCSHPAPHPLPRPRPGHRPLWRVEAGWATWVDRPRQEDT